MRREPPLGERANERRISDHRSDRGWVVRRVLQSTKAKHLWREQHKSQKEGKANKGLFQGGLSGKAPRVRLRAAHTRWLLNQGGKHAERIAGTDGDSAHG